MSFLILHLPIRAPLTTPRQLENTTPSHDASATGGTTYLVVPFGVGGGLVLRLRSPRQCVHHDGHHVLVDAEDAHQVRVLEEHVVVHQGPARHGRTVRTVTLW